MPVSLQIVTPYGEVYRGEVASVVMPGAEGEFGVMPAHERFLTPLRVGELVIDDGSTVLYAATGGGFAEVTGEEIAVLVDSCELAHDIDTARADLARERAEQNLAGLEDADEARRREFEEALVRARTRLAVSQRAR